MIHRLRRPVAALLLILLSASALAQGGLSFGVALYPIDMVAGANITVPMFRTGPAQHAARVDVSYAFRGLPALSATYLLRDANPGRTQTYLGMGGGLAFASGPAAATVLSLHALAGANVRISSGLGAFGEVIVAGNALATNMRLALGVNYTLGGN